jgi:hypothetical protein
MNPTAETLTTAASAPFPYQLVIAISLVVGAICVATVSMMSARTPLAGDHH